MTKLPSELTPHLGDKSATITRAYSTLLDLEKSTCDETDSRRLIYTRILGYLILEGPSDQARVAVAQEVISCGNSEDVLDLGKMYCGHYLRAFRKTNGPSPPPSFHPSRCSFETTEEMTTSMMTEAPQDHRSAKRNALVRDGFRCVVSGYYDHASVMDSRELKKQFLFQTSTHCAHIFDESTNANIGNLNHQHASSVWAIMDRFGYKKLPEELKGHNIHRLQNVLTLESSTHEAFDRLALWFEPTDTPHTYSLHAVAPGLILPHFKTRIEFTTPDPERLPPPSPEYLQIHAACAKVAHLSGASKYIDKTLMELEDICVLSESGASAEALEYALLPLNHA